MNAWFRGKSIPCPNCGSRDIDFHSSSRWLRDDATLCAQRICNECRTVFEPPLSTAGAFVAIGFGVGMLLFAIDTKVPLVYDEITSHQFVDSIVNLAFLLAAVGYGLYLMNLGRLALQRKEPRIVDLLPQENMNAGSN